MDNNNIIAKKVAAIQSGRLDVVVSKMFPEFTRSLIQKSIKEQGITVEGQSISPSFKVEEGQMIEVQFIKSKLQVEIDPQKVDYTVVYEDQEILIIDKPKGLMVHPGAGPRKPTLVDGLVFDYPEIQASLESKEDVIRPGIVHRLDQFTTGLLVVAKTRSSLLHLKGQFKTKSAKRKYDCFYFGVNPTAQSQQVETLVGRHPKRRTLFHAIELCSPVPSGYRNAISHFALIDTYPYGFYRLEVLLSTGRTHQIRVHAKHIGGVVVGDTSYGYKPSTCSDPKIRKFLEGLNGPMLHAKELDIIHPKTGKAMTFAADAPLVFNKFIDMLNK